MYLGVLLIRPPPPHFVHYIQPKVGGELIFEYAISLEYKPPPPKKKFYAIATYTSKVHVYIRTQLRNTVGHAPREFSRVCWYFLHKSGSEMTCIVNGDRRRSEVDGKGLVVPCVYIFKGKQKHLERLINLFAKLTG